MTPPSATGPGPSPAPGQVLWLPPGETAARCPVCGDGAPKANVLQVMTLGDGARPVTLVACSACSVRIYADLGAPNPFSDVPEAAALQQFELGIGLRGSIDCLPRIDTQRVRTFLEVGCGTGLTLDFARHVFGWEVLGVDTSAMAALAPDQLGVPVVDGLLGESDAVARGAWDLVFACEVIEHVADPAPFLAAVRDALAPGGVFLLRTPAVEELTPARPDNEVIGPLSPGFHTMIHSAVSLERTLRDAGFTSVAVMREGDTLHAAAATGPLHWEPGATLSTDQVDGYLSARAAELPAGSAARLGLLQQLANNALNRADPVAARAALTRLDAALRTRHGHGLRSAAREVPAFSASPYCGAFIARALLAGLEGDAACAEERYAAAALAADAGIRALAEVNMFDPGLVHNQAAATVASLLLQLQRDPASLPELLPAWMRDPADERSAATLSLFTAAMAAGADPVVDELLPVVPAILDGPRPAPRAAARDARWTLAMVLLHREGDPAGAAAQFARARAEADDPARWWSAHFHEAYGQWYAGGREAAAPALREVVEAALAEPAGPAAPWADQARSLLAHAG